MDPRTSDSIRKLAGFTFAEVLVAIAVVALFGAAAFATNERLLISLRNQREETAASMMLQERMEQFRANSYSNIANKDYVTNSILTFNPSPSPSPTPNFPPGGQFTTWSEAPLGNLKETITISGYQIALSPTPDATPGPSPAATPYYCQWLRDTTQGDHHPHEQVNYDHLATMYDLIQVDIYIQWQSANGRIRNRELAAIFGKGNVAQ